MGFMDLFKKRPQTGQTCDTTELLDHKKTTPSITTARVTADKKKVDISYPSVTHENTAVQSDNSNVGGEQITLIPTQDGSSDTIRSEDPLDGYYSYLSSGDTPPGTYRDHPWPFKAKVPSYEKRNLIILAVENTSKVNLYRNVVLKLVSKIISDNKQDLFLILKLSNQNKYFDLLSTEDLKNANLPECLLSVDNASCQVKLADALTHIYNFSKPLLKSFATISYNNLIYEINDIRIIFIGTGSKDANTNDEKEASEILHKLCESKEVKTIKYFCINDEDAIGAASIGFPIIGHIESNFYK